MELFAWLEVMPDLAELKCAIVTHGGQCVMICGMSRMLEWCADNLDCHHHVNILISPMYIHEGTFGIGNHLFCHKLQSCK